MHDPHFALRCFKEAAPLWLASRVKIRSRTRQDYQQYMRALIPQFGELPLRKIHLGHIRDFQLRRSENAGPARVNHELCLLAQVLKRAGLWNTAMQEGCSCCSVIQQLLARRASRSTRSARRPRRT
jgi:hypothetical protein